MHSHKEIILNTSFKVQFQFYVSSRFEREWSGHFSLKFCIFILLQCDQICAKFHNFVKILKYFGNFERVYLVFSIFNLLWQI